VLGVNIKDQWLCEEYRELCGLTAEGYFMNLDFSTELKSSLLGPNKLSVSHCLRLVEGSLQLLDSTSMPLIIEHIGLN